MHESMQYDPIQGQDHDSRVLERRKFGHFQKLSLPHLQRGLANDQGFLNYCTIPNAYRGWIFDYFPSFCVT